MVSTGLPGRSCGSECEVVGRIGVYRVSSGQLVETLHLGEVEFDCAPFGVEFGCLKTDQIWVMCATREREISPRGHAGLL